MQCLLLLRRSSRSDVQFNVSDVGCCPPQVLQGAVELGLQHGRRCPNSGSVVTMKNVFAISGQTEREGTTRWPTKAVTACEVATLLGGGPLGGANDGKGKIGSREA